MMTKQLKKSVLFLTSLLLSVVIAVLACGGGDWDDTQGSMFTPEIINKKAFTPFFRTRAYPIYGENYFAEHNTVCNDLNVSEWKIYFDGKVSDDMLRYWLYRAPGMDVNTLLLNMQGKKAELNDSINKFNIAVAVPGAKTSAFLYYLGFAKRNEAFAVNTSDYWSDEKEKKDLTPDMAKQIEGGLKLFANAKSEFLKERYIFQLTRLYYFSNQFNEAIGFFEKNEAVLKTPGMKWRTLGYAAGAHYKNKNYSKANYYYSLIFDQFEPHKLSAFLSFHPQNDGDWNECLALAKSNREKIVLWELFGLYFEPKKSIEEIYKLDPSSDVLELMLVRTINIEEEKFSQGLIPSYGESLNAPEKYVPEKDLIALLSRISEDKKVSDPSLWNLATAYMYYVTKDFASGDKYLDRAEKERNKSAMFKSQFHLVSLFGKLSRENSINEKIEKRILTDVQQLFSLETVNLPKFRSDYAITWVRNTLAVLYAKQGEVEKAEMVRPSAVKNHFNNMASIRKMIAYFDSPNHTELERFFMQQPTLNKQDYLNLLGIRYAQSEMLDSSLITFNKMNVPRELYGNPFTIHIKDCHDCDHMAKQKIKYTSKTFISKMIEMKTKAEANRAEAAQNYFLVANGFYNMTYFGNARVFYENSVDYFDFYFDYSDETSEPEMDCSLAAKYYQLAYDNASDPEMKAKCTFMLAKCELNTWYMNKPKDFKGDFKAGKFFAKLKNEFRNTKYYSEVIKECSYFRWYAEGY